LDVPVKSAIPDRFRERIARVATITTGTVQFLQSVNLYQTNQAARGRSDLPQTTFGSGAGIAQIHALVQHAHRRLRIC
jgi:hypothetical protein